MNYFCWYCLNTTVRKFNNIGTINAIQKKFVYLHEMGEKVKSPLYKSQRYCCKFILASAFICQQSSFLFQHGKKAMYTYIIQKFSPIRHFYFVSEQRNIYLIFQHLREVQRSLQQKQTNPDDASAAVWK